MRNKVKSVYNIIVSNGELGFARKSVRRQEALDAAKIIGVKEVIFLDYFDGKVPCNIDIQTIRALARYHGFQVNVKYAEIFKPYHYVINMID